MASLKINNASVVQTIAKFLDSLSANPGENGRIDPNQLPFIRDMFLFPGLSLPSVFKTALTGVPSFDNSNASFKPTSYQFTTLALSEGNQDLETVFNIKGSNLIPLSTRSRGTDMDIRFSSVRYLTEDKSVENIKSIYSGNLTQTLKYSPFNLANDVEGDGTIKVYGVRFSSSGTEFDRDGDNLTTYAETGNRSMRSDVMVNETGSYAGKVFSISISGTSKGSDQSNFKDSLSMSSQKGFNIDSADNYSGVINSINFSQSYRDNNFAQSINLKVSNTQQDIAIQLGRYMKGEISVAEFAEVVFSKNDVITATNGFNVINGYAGNDRLIGGKGIDHFEFTTALNRLNNIDRIENFKRNGADKILLSQEIFQGYTGADNFVLGSRALDADDRIIYNRTSGALFYDSDGTGAAAQIQFATLVGKPVIDANDFIVI